MLKVTKNRAKSGNTNHKRKKETAHDQTLRCMLLNYETHFLISIPPYNCIPKRRSLFPCFMKLYLKKFFAWTYVPLTTNKNYICSK